MSKALAGAAHLSCQSYSKDFLLVDHSKNPKTQRSLEPTLACVRKEHLSNYASVIHF